MGQPRGREDTAINRMKRLVVDRNPELLLKISSENVILGHAVDDV